MLPFLKIEDGFDFDPFDFDLIYNMVELQEAEKPIIAIIDTL